ncbi:ubiquinol-cytochrome c reductase iron-sulfur subunit [Nodosilinea sp. PGN35]|uniref:QcrA and Rieske domain-containing protein n=1 Tax=Nodosilinea sp. PGN35 TaxID=3020489 RepID=UPI0023B2777E|nr:ubiquinol-cytochrome c reductase iron-sulfur subunit [Nodosilinea sp. TSF1-S3]MDF0368610.1 ubiquinol-cytochrome c reductase iron-sulfur subunit [Nodosilinea sp. TSF1-S3]
MKRREFSNLLGLGLLATSLPVAIAACQSDSAPTADSGGADDGFVALGTVAELDAQGALANSNVQGKNLAVIRDPGAPESVIAVSALCTHAGCTVVWNGEQSLFACPCHGSNFNPDGSVNSGPTREPLATFEAKVEGDQVLVKV